MNNPNGPYPGRQIFIGLNIDKKPSFAYLVTGRSPESRERKAVAIENTIRMGPSGNAQYDPLRHYSAVKYDDKTGVLVVTNGIQTEALYETYKLMVNTQSEPWKDYSEEIMEGAGAEPDSYRTPRIAGVVTPWEGRPGMALYLVLKNQNEKAEATEINLEPGIFAGISTYNGDMSKPVARDFNTFLPTLECKATTAADLAKFIFDISAAEYQGNDIRVCAVAGVWNDGKWELAIKNVH